MRESVKKGDVWKLRDGTFVLAYTPGSVTKVVNLTTGRADFLHHIDTTDAKFICVLKDALEQAGV